jgi:hypothetical protein
MIKRGNIEPKDYLHKIFDPKTEDKKIQDALEKVIEKEAAQVCRYLLASSFC